MEKKFLMVRAMQSSQSDFDIFFNNSVVAVGWSKVDFSQSNIRTDIDAITSLVKISYYDNSSVAPQVVGRHLSQIKRFNSIAEGDYLVIPFRNSIRLAIAEKEILFDKNAYNNDLSNQRKVSYKLSGGTYKTIPRNALSEALQTRLRAPGSIVSNLIEFKDEIEKLFSHENYSWTANIEEEENKLKAELKSKILVKIRNGNTNLKSGGIGLENLVKELFVCEGYVAKILSKKTFEFGDADVLAVKIDKFQETKLLVQVKHHTGHTDDWGLLQLNEIKSSENYKDYKFVLITSAEISSEVRKIAEELDIVAVDGNELADWLIENLNKLSIGTKTILGLSAIPQVAY